MAGFQLTSNIYKQRSFPQFGRNRLKCYKPKGTDDVIILKLQ